MNTTVEIQEVVDRLRQSARFCDYGPVWLWNTADELLALGFRLEKEPHK